MHKGRHETPRRRTRRVPLALAVMLMVGTTAVPAWAGRPDDFDANGNATHFVSDAGFDEFGYNYTARIFSGPATGWCLKKGLSVDCLGTYSNDHLVMKWNAEWDRGNAEGWANPPYDAWETNEWNGMFPGGSGENWHYKIQWVGPCVEGAPLPDGGYCIWGQFEVLMDQGISGGEHISYALALPNGFGS